MDTVLNVPHVSRRKQLAGMLVWHLVKRRGISSDPDEFCKDLVRIAQETDVDVKDLCSFARAFLHALVEAMLSPLYTGNA